jgi:hypothetical protein
MPDKYDPSGQNRQVPTVAAGAGLGTSPPAPAISADSNDERGTVTFGSGTTPPGGALVTVTFVQPRDPNRLPRVMLQESTLAAAGVDLAVTSVTSTGFTVSSNTRNVAASQAAGTYGFYYSVTD